ncbi:CLUMA_CG016087, isoform A [Clunio marinus]|uniref:CLUMA_CG016087, isoform A n=1 Tax=Clunio marinus TaxID=568069 RepID=A0A1J1ISL7_9DIPT|nr:CLUMA_CG016087, isoform A [Clunio marinus]
MKTFFPSVPKRKLIHYLERKTRGKTRLRLCTLNKMNSLALEKINFNGEKLIILSLLHHTYYVILCILIPEKN